MNTLKVSLLLLITMSVKSTVAQITGTTTNPKDALSLTNQEGVQIAAKVDPTGKYTIPIKGIKKGIYTLSGVGDIYLEPDYKVSITGSDGVFTFNGKGSTENNLLQHTRLTLHKFQSKSGYGLPMSAFLTEPEHFLPVVDAYRTGIHTLLSKSGNKTFTTIVKGDAEYRRINILYNYKLFYGMDSSKMDSLKKYLSIPLAKRTKDHSQLTFKAYQMQFTKKLSDSEKEQLEAIMYNGWDINDESLFKNSAAYRDAISNRLSYFLMNNKQLRDSFKNDNNSAKIAIAERDISNAYIRDHFKYTYTLAAIKAAKSSEAIRPLYEDYLAKNAGSKHKAAIESAFANVVSTEKNADAPDFSYPNTSGELVSLKGMKGNYVYIDLWATWCAPCIAEIPDLKKLEDQYHGKNIKFVSISIDKAQDKDKWLKFADENDLKGVQLMADKDWNSDFVKKFGVNSIPRFILIGPDGKVIDNNAKRPSNPILKTELDKFFVQSNKQ